MANPLPIAGLTIWQLAIPLRRPFSHAAAQRTVADPIIVAVELADRTVGYGETHPRPYVTGESHQDVLRSIREVFLPILVDWRPANFGEAIEAAADLPHTDKQDRVITAARAAVELALLDAYAFSFNRSLEALAGWLDQPGFGPPGSRETARFSGVISSGEPGRIPSSIRKMRLFGLRCFKLKVGDEGDEERLHAAVRALEPGLTKGRTTLRLDANGAWTFDQAVQRLRDWQTLPITCVEQPLSKDEAHPWSDLAKRTALPLMADESLVTLADARRLIADSGVAWFNIRISKNGGLIPSLELAALARRHGIKCQLGCMVGETSILSAAGRWFLQSVPDVRFAEGSFGRFLLKQDITERSSLRFGFGGRWRTAQGPGLGIRLDRRRLDDLAAYPAEKLPL